MSKKFSFALILAIVLSMMVCLTGCGETDVNSTDADTNNTTNNSSVDNTSEDTTTNSETTSTESKVEESKPTPSTPTSSTPKPENKPTVLNPKTNIKLDKYYYGKFLSTDGKTYSTLNFSFHDGGEWGYSYTYSLTNYYTKEYCTERLGGFGMEFSEDEYAEYSITVKGIKYYTIDFLNMGSAHTCEFTDNAIILSDDENEIATLSLLSDGTLVVKSIKSEKYGPVGTVFAIKQ